MRYTLRQMECFAALAEVLHFGRAADRVNMTQPAFSRQIMAIEQAVDVKLVDRTSHKVTITAAGTAFLEGCRDAFAALDRGDRRAKLIERGFEGNIRFGYTDFAISSELPGLLHDFRKEFPRIMLEPLQGSTRELLHEIEGGRLDIAFVTGPIREDELASLPFTRNDLVVVLWEGHPLAGKPEISIDDLADEDFVFGIPRLWSHYMRHIERVFDDAAIQPHIVERAFNSEGLFGLVAGQMGITIYPDCVRNYYRRGLVLRDVEDLTATIPTLAVWRSEAETAALSTFHTFMLSRIKP